MAAGFLACLHHPFLADCLIPEAEVFSKRPMEQVGVLHDHGNLGKQAVCPDFPDVPFLHADMPHLIIPKPGHEPEQRGFPTAGRPHQGGKGAGGRFKGDVPDYIQSLPIPERHVLKHICIPVSNFRLARGLRGGHDRIQPPAGGSHPTESRDTGHQHQLGLHQFGGQNKKAGEIQYAQAPAQKQVHPHRHGYRHDEPHQGGAEVAETARHGFVLKGFIPQVSHCLFQGVKPLAGTVIGFQVLHAPQIFVDLCSGVDLCLHDPAAVLLLHLGNQQHEQRTDGQHTEHG